MYTFEEKERIIELLKNGTSIEDLHRIYNIPMPILHNWEEEMRIRRRIKNLRILGRFYEAEQELEKLTGENTEPIRLSIQIGIAKGRKERAQSIGDVSKERKYRQKQKELLQIQLEKQPDDVIAINGLIAIAREECDLKTERRLLRKQLKINPNNIAAMRTLLHLVGEDEKRRIMRRIQKVQKSDKSETDSPTIIANDGENNGKVRMEELHKEEGTREQEKETPAQKARRILRENTDIEKTAEEINEILQGQSSIDVALVLAELYYCSGLKDRAQKHLKAYKKTIEKTTDSIYMGVVNHAMELARNNNTPRYKWDEFWQKVESIQNIQKGPVLPEIPGDDGNR